MKRIISLVLVLAMWLSMSVAVFAFDTSKDTKIELAQQVSGSYFGDSSKAVKTESDLNATLNISSLIFNGNNISLIATATHPEGKISIDTTGTLYKSVISDANYVGLFDKNAVYTILSFVIEMSPGMRGLLTTTQNSITKACRASEDSPVIKIAVMINATEEVIYFEDTIDITNISKIVTASKKSLAAMNVDIKDSLYKNERWFMFFNEDSYAKVEASSKDVDDMVMILDLLNEDSQYINLTEVNSRLESPIPAIDANLFKTEGESIMTTNEWHGWYMNTREWPVDSDMYYSNLTKWSYITPSAVSKSPEDENEGHIFNFKVMASGEYLYDCMEDEIYQSGTYANYRLGDARVVLSLKSQNSDIFTSCEYTQQYSTMSYTDTAAQLLGMYSRTTLMGSILSLIDSLQSDTISAHMDSFRDNLAACAGEYGTENGQPRGIVMVGIAMPVNKKMFIPDDRLIISAVWKKPADSDNYYIYNTLTKTLEIAYLYNIYNGNQIILGDQAMVHTRYYY